MTQKRKRLIEVARDAPSPEADGSATAAEAGFDPSFLAQIRELAASGLTSSSALSLITKLIAETPGASKEAMDRIKMMDKLLNTARAMMETRLKNEEAAAITAKLDEMELLIEKLAIQRAGEPNRCVEVRDGRGQDE